jgi:hypothetical protein
MDVARFPLVQSPTDSMLDQHEQEQEQQVVGQLVVPPGVSTTLVAKQVEPTC